MSHLKPLPLDQAIAESMDLAQQAIEQIRAEIAHSQVLSQTETDLAQAIGRIADKHDAPTDRDDDASPDARPPQKESAPRDDGTL